MFLREGLDNTRHEMIIDGRALAQKRRGKILASREGLKDLSLGVVMAVGNMATESFVRIKTRVAGELGIGVAQYRLTEEATNDDVLRALSEAGGHDGIILQLPLSKSVDVELLRNAIPENRDVDLLGDAAFQVFESGKSVAIPPVAAAMKYICDAHDISYAGKNVVVVGQGRLVGLPASTLFKQLGGEVTIVNKGEDIGTRTRSADIIILGAGSPHMLTPDMVKEGVVVLDAGTSEAGGKVAGDADPRVAEKASLFTPVPGGIGPIAVAEIFANLIALRKVRDKSQNPKAST